MPSSIRVGDMQAALAERLFPSVTMWNRLEGRPRTQDFQRALQAEVRDALWMLSRQWQLGEFRGSDAGSPVFAKVRVDSSALTRYRPGDGGAVVPFDDATPFEAQVERRPVPLRIGGQIASLDLRLAMGRQWQRLIAPIGAYAQAFTDAYPVTAPDPTVAADAQLCSEPPVFALFAAAAGRLMDGGLLYEHLVAAPGNHAYDGVAGFPNGDGHAIDLAADAFLAWFARLIMQPDAGGNDAWTPAHLEYRFAVSAPEPGGAKVYSAEEYYQGRLDWYSVDVSADPIEPAAAAGPAAGPAPAPPPAPDPTTHDVRTTLPVPVTFTGVPNTRWWSFEERRTNYGDVDASTTDLAKLMFLEFALVYANDWFVIPFTLAAGSLANVRGLAVTNTFGERFWIEAAGSGAGNDWQRWSMFSIDQAGPPGTPADLTLLLLPTVAKLDSSPPAEDVWLIRDEVADMVWGVETAVPLASGETAPGVEAGSLLRAFLAARLPPPAAPPAPVAPIRYEVMSSVPENWIPFIPVHVDGSNREIQLQRAALPRILAGDPNPPVKVQPRTVLLRQGLDQSPAQTYFVAEEEVPRAGTRVLQSYQRTRWTDGSVVTWLRVRRQTGRGEGSSGLRFDFLVNQGQQNQ
jgi:hypothetical protein